jgi:anti-sigma-K factor RskA
MDDLLGAYALDALDADDRARVDAYLAGSTDAQREIDELQETAAMLALAPAPGERAPADLWSRISDNIGPASTEGTTQTATVTAIDEHRRRRTQWIIGSIAAAAAIIIVLLAVQVVHLRGQVDNLQSTGPVASADLFNRATQVPGAQVASFTGSSGPVARVVVLPDGTGYLENDGLSTLPSDKTYQLWALTGDPAKPTAISAGVLGSSPHAAAFKVAGPVHAFAITEEQAGGVVSSQNQPLAVAKLA